MGLYDRIMSATNNPTTALKVNAAAQSAARVASDSGHPGLAGRCRCRGRAVRRGGQRDARAQANDGPYASFDTDDR
ncbi:hypothetical protein ACGFWI_27355 [Streptomyces sp. NPDC048434]|uniref:hypothetical protein n=1 Tax=Streptomyces sp. NPDC048434 TaxID=3365549 RepID=UPI0037242455